MTNLKITRSPDRPMALALSSLILLAAAPGVARAQLSVVTTTQDLASIAREVGGDKIAVESLSAGNQDPHFVEPKPSLLLKLNKAALLIAVGRELEVAWLPPLLTQARNAKIQPGTPGFLDASIGVRILDIPTGQITRAMGDVHPSGNPHYWLDPGNGLIIARAIETRLGELIPAERSYFAQRVTAFAQRLADAQKRWDAKMSPFKGVKIVTYHRSWANLVDRFGLNVVGYIEPKPGIPPPPRHIVDLIAEMRTQQIKVILVEPYFDLRTPESIARETGGSVLVLPPSVGGVTGVGDYIALFDYIVNQLSSALARAAGR
jgi:ABC-type Zn uptake system ZnuABC Zn-binding protein ZnuA